MVGQLWIRETMSRTLELRLRRFEVTGLPHSHVTVLLSRKALQLLFMRLALPYSKFSVAWIMLWRSMVLTHMTAVSPNEVLLRSETALTLSIFLPSMSQLAPYKPSCG